MKMSLFATATVAVALLGGAAHAQDHKMPTAPTSQSAAPAETVAEPQVDTEVTTSSDTTTSTDVTAPAASATTYAQTASVTTTTVTNGPVADTPENRAKYGQPMSRAGKRTAAKGN